VANSLALGTSPIVRALVDPEGGMADIRALDGVSFTQWFTSHGGSMNSIRRMWDPIGEPIHPLPAPVPRRAALPAWREGWLDAPCAQQTGVAAGGGPRAYSRVLLRRSTRQAALARPLDRLFFPHIQVS
jgi:hypothetical protein